ncbi:MAG: ABC transporter ATP-binding protein/permease [Defluviitaleaceae bacterium]|nr:ABC transporter ATP-binding protein/permease [Defluviitaleaceae bacterium]
MKEYTFEYDLGLDMSPSAGRLVFREDGEISIQEYGVPAALTLSTDGVEEIAVRAGVGCGLLYVKYKTPEDADKETPDFKLLCRFTMSGLDPAGEFCKIVNFYITTGTIDIPEIVEKRVCEKCNRPMVKDIRVCVFCYNQFGVLKRAGSFIKPYAKTLTLSQLMSMFTLITFLSAPIFTRLLVDRFWEPQLGTLAEVGLLIGIMFFLRFGGELVFIMTARIFNKAAIHFSNDMRVATYQKLQSHSMTLFAKRTPGDLIRRIVDDTGVVGDFFTDLARWMMEMIIMILLAFTILFITNWRLAFLVLAPVPIVFYCAYRFRLLMRARFERQWRKGAKVNSILHDIIKGIRTVKAFGNEEKEIKKYADANHELASIGSDNEKLWSLMFPPMGFISGIGEFLVLFIGGWMVLNQAFGVTLGVLFQFTMYMGFIFWPLRMLSNAPRWIANTTTSMVKIFELLDDESEIKEAKTPKSVPISGDVAYDNVTFGYKSYEPVLKGVDLKINPGEMIGLVGKSGVGKSTLINLAMRLYDPNTGRIAINDTDIRDISPSHLHENTGVVFQDTFLFAGTFYENIAYGKPGASYEEVIAASKAANAHDFITQTADGYETLVGEGGQTLSGGERQRLSIARAIIKNPDLLILDEATSSLDVETESLIQDSLNRITQGRTTIAIAHRLSTLRNADRLVVLDEGGVAEVGTHRELLSKKGLYYNLVMAQRQSSRKEENAESKS